MVPKAYVKAAAVAKQNVSAAAENFIVVVVFFRFEWSLIIRRGVVAIETPEVFGV